MHFSWALTLFTLIVCDMLLSFVITSSSVISLSICAWLLIRSYVFYVTYYNAGNTNASVVCEIKITYLHTYLLTYLFISYDSRTTTSFLLQTFIDKKDWDDMKHHLSGCRHVFTLINERFDLCHWTLCNTVTNTVGMGKRGHLPPPPSKNVVP